MEVILGMAGALLSVILFLAGGACGWVLHSKAQTPSIPASDKPLSEAEQKKREEMIREQDAFRKMMSYNAEMAYDMYSEEAKGDELI